MNLIKTNFNNIVLPSHIDFYNCALKKTIWLAYKAKTPSLLFTQWRQHMLTCITTGQSPFLPSLGSPCKCFCTYHNHKLQVHGTATALQVVAAQCCELSVVSSCSQEATFHIQATCQMPLKNNSLQITFQWCSKHCCTSKQALRLCSHICGCRSAGIPAPAHKTRCWTNNEKHDAIAQYNFRIVAF